MLTITSQAGGQFRIGRVMSGALRLLYANFLFIVAVSAVANLPMLYFSQDRTQTVEFQWDDFGWSDFWLFVAVILFWFALNAIGQAIILFGAFMKLRGRPVRIGEALRRTLARALPLLGLSLLYSLAIGLGFILLVVPGLVLTVIWSVCVAACVIEGLGPIASLSRSSVLTKGYRWKIFGVALLLFVAAIVASGIAGLLLADAGAQIAGIGDMVVQSIWTAYWNCIVVMIYHDLRVAKDGVDTTQIAAVFD